MSLRRAWFLSDVTVFNSCDVAMVMIELIRAVPADGGKPTDVIIAETEVTFVKCEENGKKTSSSSS